MSFMMDNKKDNKMKKQYTQINHLLCKLSATTKTTDKKKLLLSLTYNKISKEVFRYALDPYITFGLLSDFGMPDINIDNSLTEQDWDDVKNVLDKLAARELTGNAAREVVRELVTNHKKAEVIKPIVARILAKDLRCGVRASTVNSVIENLIPTFKCALAKEGAIIIKGKLIETGNIKYPAWSEPKSDGVRTLAIKRDGHTTAYSRNGKEYRNFINIVKAIDDLEVDNCVFDGEVEGETFDAVMNVAHTKNRGRDDKDLHFKIWDFLSLEDWEANKTEYIQSERTGHVYEALKNYEANKLGCKYLRQMLGRVVTNEEEMMQHFKSCRDAGYEGTVVKDMNAVYPFKRNKCWSKVKEMLTADGIIVDCEEGKGKYKGMLGAILVEIDGVITRVGSGFSDDERNKYWNEREELKGQWVEIKGQEFTKDKCLRFPTFLRFRPDRG